MIGALIHVLEKGLGKFLSYKRLVEISNKFNVPLAPPLTSAVQVTLRCNSKCSYCPLWRLRNGYQVSLNNLDEVFNSLRKIGVRSVTLTGGGPLTRKDLEEVVSLAKHHGMLVDVCTNGILLTKERALKLAEVGVNGIMLSLDTSDPEIYEKHRGIPFRFAERALTSLVYITNQYPAIHGNVTCVVSRYNIGKLVSFVNWIYEYGEGKISVTLQPFHRLPPFPDAQNLTQKSLNLANKLLAYYQDKTLQGEFIPNPELRSIFESVVRELIQLKKLRRGSPLNNSEFYLKSMADFLFDNKMPDGFNCVADYIGIVVRSNLEVAPCWRLPPIGDLEEEELMNIWFSERYRRQRMAMKHLKCPGCMLLCHTESSWDEWYNMIYKSSRSKAVKIGQGKVNE